MFLNTETAQAVGMGVFSEAEPTMQSSHVPFLVYSNDSGSYADSLARLVAVHEAPEMRHHWSRKLFPLRTGSPDSGRVTYWRRDNAPADAVEIGGE